MPKIAFTNLIAAVICLSLSAGPAHAQFNLGGKLGSISKKTRSKISAPTKSISKPNLAKVLPGKNFGNLNPKMPVTLPKQGRITLPNRGIGFPKPSMKLPKSNPITPPSLGIDLPTRGPIALPKTPIKFPVPGKGIQKTLPIKLPNPGPVAGPKAGTGPIVPPGPGITPLPEPIKQPRPDGCWEPPRRCNWWVDICTPIRTCRPVDVVRCHWNYVHCDAVIGGQIVPNTRWYLGVEGIFLPGKGLGIESVTEGSPAANVGLTAGMVIIEANGIAMETEEAMQQAIATSQGLLNVIVLSEGSEQTLGGTIQMLRLTSARF